MKKALVIGCGNMGSAIATALLEKQIFTRDTLHILERRENRQTLEMEGKGVAILKEFRDITEHQELVILAVKPQDSPLVLQALAPHVNEDSLVISIMAGITIKQLESYLPNSMIIRAMPNTPSAIQMGMTAYCGNSKVKPTDSAVAQVVLGGMGKAIETPNEAMIDSATAISGSGPAYVFYLAEAMIEAALEFGFGPKDARDMVTQTLYGAAALLDGSSEEARDLRIQVTSKGGTTEAALNTFDNEGIMAGLIKGIKAAKSRSEELGRG